MEVRPFVGFINACFGDKQRSGSYASNGLEFMESLSLRVRESVFVVYWNMPLLQVLRPIIYRINEELIMQTIDAVNSSGLQGQQNVWFD